MKKDTMKNKPSKWLISFGCLILAISLIIHFVIVGPYFNMEKSFIDLYRFGELLNSIFILSGVSALLVGFIILYHEFKKG